MSFTKRFPISNTSTLIKRIITIITFFYFVEKTFAHGVIVNPKIRMFSFDNDILQMTAGPTTQQPCSGFEAGSIVATYQSGQLIPITWKIFTAHQGNCSVQLSTNGKDSEFQELKSYSNCADEIGTFNDNVQLPTGVTCEKCTLRWVWNSALNGELYLQCSDIKIGGENNTVSPATTTLPISKTISNISKITMTSTTKSPAYTSSIATPTKIYRSYTRSSKNYRPYTTAVHRSKKQCSDKYKRHYRSEEYEEEYEECYYYHSETSETYKNKKVYY